MKVVLFFGGLGTRIREYSENIPKPMVPVGNQPILHVIHRDQLNEVRAGVIDHMAFTATYLPGTVAKLQKAGLEYELRRLPQGGVREGLWQLFFDDPHGGKVEFDFDKDEPAPAGYAE